MGEDNKNLKTSSEVLSEVTKRSHNTRREEQDIAASEGRSKTSKLQEERKKVQKNLIQKGDNVKSKSPRWQKSNLHNALSRTKVTRDPPRGP